MSDPTIYQLIGGEPGLRSLVHRFYAIMDELPETYGIRKIHPEDLQHSADLLFDFLSGWFGGPPLFEQKYGHPRLRRRHMPYQIGPDERDQWMLCMEMTLAESVSDEALRGSLVQRFQEMADHLINRQSAHSCSQHFSGEVS